MIVWGYVSELNISRDEYKNISSTGSPGYSFKNSSSERALNVFARFTNTFFPSLCFSTNPFSTSEDTTSDIVEWSNPSVTSRSDMETGCF